MVHRWHSRFANFVWNWWVLLRCGSQIGFCFNSDRTRNWIRQCNIRQRSNVTQGPIHLKTRAQKNPKSFRFFFINFAQGLCRYKWMESCVVVYFTRRCEFQKNVPENHFLPGTIIQTSQAWLSSVWAYVYSSIYEYIRYFRVYSCMIISGNSICSVFRFVIYVVYFSFRSFYQLILSKE